MAFGLFGPNDTELVDKQYSMPHRPLVATIDLIRSTHAHMHSVEGGAVYSRIKSQSISQWQQKWKKKPQFIQKFQCRSELERDSVNRLFNALIKHDVAALIAQPSCRMLYTCQKSKNIIQQTNVL